MDRVRIRILVGVAAKTGETPVRRKGPVSLAMSVSQGLVDPNLTHNRVYGKGKWLIFHYCFSIRGNASLVSNASE